MLFNIDEKQLMLELKNKDERALKIWAQSQILWDLGFRS